MNKPATVSLLLALAAFAAGTNAADPPAAAQDTQPAVWVTQEVSFTFARFGVWYACDTLRDKIKVLVLALGARRGDLQAYETECTDRPGAPSYSGVQLKLSTLRPAAGEAAQPPSGVVAARWKSVTTSDYPGLLRPADCQLLVQFKRQILPAFTARNVQIGDDPCPPGRTPARIPLLRLEVLAAEDDARKPASK